MKTELNAFAYAEFQLTGKGMFTVYSYTSGILDTFHKEVIAFNKLLLEGYEDES